MIRAATRDDLPALARVFVAAWHGAYREVVPADVLAGITEQAARELLGNGLDSAHLRTDVLARSGEVVGFARYGCDPDRPDAANAGYLAALYVRPGASGSGAGRALLDHVLHALHRDGRDDVTLWVFAANARARRLYERAGFRPDGVETTDPRWRAPQVRYRRAARLGQLPLVPVVPDSPVPAITALDVEPVISPLREPFRTALREVRELRGHRITLHTADGLVATGTTVATPPITGDTDESILAALHGPLRGIVGRAGSLRELLALVHAVPGVPSARAAVDVALHRLAAVAAGTTLDGLLSAGPGPVRSDVTISVDTPDTMAAAAQARVADGFTTLKVKLGGAPAETEIHRVHAVAAAAGASITLRADANQAWDATTSLRILDGIAEAGVTLELIEQPVPAADLAGLATVAERSPFPVLADEAVFTAADVPRVPTSLVNLKLLKCGGLQPALEVLAACRDSGRGVLVGCMLEPAEGIAAATALAAAATPPCVVHDLDAGWWLGAPPS